MASDANILPSYLSPLSPRNQVPCLAFLLSVVIEPGLPRLSTWPRVAAAICSDVKTTPPPPTPWSADAALVLDPDRSGRGAEVATEEPRRMIVFLTPVAGKLEEGRGGGPGERIHVFLF